MHVSGISRTFSELQKVLLFLLDVDVFHALTGAWSHNIQTSMKEAVVSETMKGSSMLLCLLAGRASPLL